MVNSGAMPIKAPLLEVDPQRNTRSHIFKTGIVLIGGSCLVLLGVMAISGSNQTLQSTATNLIGMPTSLRKPFPTLHTLPGNSPFKDLTIAAIEAGGRCERDVSMKGVNAVMASMSPANRARVEKAEVDMVTAATAKAEEVLKAGVTAPLGFFDPVGLSTDVSEGRLLFLREAELKHGRVCMLAFLGILVGENYHPLFGGNVDMPAGKHFTATGGDIFWVAAYLQTIFMIGFEEKRTAFPVIEGQFITGLKPNDNPETFAATGGGRVPGDLGFDPLGLKPKKEADLVQMQNKELNNGRMAMIAVLGILAQEAVTGEKVFR